MNLTCAPGQQAAAAFMRVAGVPALVIFLDPGNIAFQLPQQADGPQVLGKFCRELAREAVLLADALDGQSGTASRTGEAP